LGSCSRTNGQVAVSQISSAEQPLAGNSPDLIAPPSLAKASPLLLQHLRDERRDLIACSDGALGALFGRPAAACAAMLGYPYPSAQPIGRPTRSPAQLAR